MSKNVFIRDIGHRRRYAFAIGPASAETRDRLVQELLELGMDDQEMIDHILGIDHGIRLFDDLCAMHPEHLERDPLEGE